MSFVIRHLVPEEWQIYRDVRLSALLDSPDAFAATYERDRRLTEREWRERTANAAWFVFDGDDAVGMAVLWPPQQPARHASLLSMWVAPQVRGSSAASGLVRQVLHDARDRGYPGVTLHVVDGNDRARAFYERLGFVNSGEKDALPDGRTETVMVHAFD